jgi:hypothetical protein
MLIAKPLPHKDTLTPDHSAALIRLPWGQVAQLVEQGTENPRVGGSIPSLATNKLNKLHNILTASLLSFV